MARLFIAIQLSADVKAALSDIIDQLKEQGIRGRYESPYNLHITLAFIGETERIDDIKTAISKIDFQPFDIELSRIGNFNKRVLWAGLTNESQLSKLSKSVCHALDSINVDYSKTPFKAHITLVRDRSDIAEDIDIIESSMTVNHISVMETTFDKGRRIYKER